MRARKADHSSFSNPEEVVVKHSHFGEQPHDVSEFNLSLVHTCFLYGCMCGAQASQHC